MKTILEFNGVEEELEALTALKAGRLFNVINEYDNYLRKLTKYEDKEVINIADARKHLWELVKYNEIEELFQ